MKGPVKLLEGEDNWVTTMGLSFGGERVVYRGRDLFGELRDIRWMELYLFGITGRRFNKKQIRLFEAIWSMGTSYPDPRIWNNRIASLSGTSRSTTSLGVGAALAVSEASLYGRRPDIKAIDFLYRTRTAVDSGTDLWEFVQTEMERHRTIPGYGRPLVNEDERIRPVCDIAERLGFGEGYFLHLIFEIERLLLTRRYRKKLNAAALGAALAADQGLSPAEYYRYLIPSFLGGIIPCQIDAASQPEGSFLPIRCTRLTYEGREQRAWT